MGWDVDVAVIRPQPKYPRNSFPRIHAHHFTEFSVLETRHFHIIMLHLFQVPRFALIYELPLAYSSELTRTPDESFAQYCTLRLPPKKKKKKDPKLVPVCPHDKVLSAFCAFLVLLHRIRQARLQALGPSGPGGWLTREITPIPGRQGRPSWPVDDHGRQSQRLLGR